MLVDMGTKLSYEISLTWLETHLSLTVFRSGWADPYLSENT